MFPVDSSVITYIGYAGGRLFLQFWPYKQEHTPQNRKAGSIFTYKNVEGWKVDQLLNAPSKGKFINYFLKNKGDPYKDHRLSPIEKRAVDFRYMDQEDERPEDEPEAERPEAENNRSDAQGDKDGAGEEFDDVSNWLYPVDKGADR
jgi:hypothetical protein